MNFNRIDSRCVYYGDVMKVDRAVVVHMKERFGKNQIGGVVHYIEPSRFHLDEEGAILLRLTNHGYVRLYDVVPIIGPIVINHTLKKKTIFPSKVIIPDTLSLAQEGGYFVNRRSVYPVMLPEKHYTLKKLKKEFYL